MIQSICPSESSPPSRLVRMTSTAPMALTATLVLAAERQRQQVDHRLGALDGVDEQIGAAVLPQQLPAPSTRHQHVAVRVDAGERDEPSAAAGVQRGHESALSAQRQSVRRVLDVATGDDATVVD